MKIAYKTEKGIFYNGTIEKALDSKKFDKYKGKVNLIFTSPPFPLNRKKKYGNLQGEEYIKWLSELAPLFGDCLAEDGSIVMEVGNSWEPGVPVMSTLALKSLLEFLEKGGLHLCQQFVWNNPAKLPSPAQWVNVKRNRVKDSFTYFWWMSKTPYPKADNRKVLVEYSKSMKNLLKNKKYNSGNRPSEHNIGEKSFLKNNKGAIPSNVITAANTQSNTMYQKYCKKNNLQPHPARMPASLPEFFIKFLTDENDLILDPFGGSNTTGMVAEELNRNWISVEPNEDYILGSKGRFKS
ncbi:DNA-methyltransferase [Spongiimicrobium sp. 3-5]|uniref:DNA-methyltransferase n=1 Tax=Spongiimicrobium sp. 3-5 TaxID=3332596 RepID=UPI0039814D13